SALQMIWGGYSVDPLGEKVLGMERAINEAIRANVLMLLYLFLIAAALVLAAMPPALWMLSQPVPQILQPVWPWRPLLVVIATLLAFLILASFLVRGSGFEQAVHDVIEKRVQSMVITAEKSSEKEPANPTHEAIERGMKIG